MAAGFDAAVLVEASVLQADASILALHDLEAFRGPAVRQGRLGVQDGTFLELGRLPLISLNKE